MAGPPRKADKDKREKISVTIPKDLVAWLDKMVDERVYANRSHGVELCIREYQKRKSEK